MVDDTYGIQHICMLTDGEPLSPTVANRTTTQNFGRVSVQRAEDEWRLILGGDPKPCP